MKLGRIFANAIARRIAYVIVAAALAWMGLSDAKAQSYSSCNSYEQATSALCPSVAAAMAGLQGSMDLHCEGKFSCPYAVTTPAQCTAINRTTTSHDCILSYQYKTNSNSQVTQATITRRVTKVPCAAGLVLNPHSNICQQPCSGKSSEVFTHADRIPGGSHGCSGGCQFAVAGNGDGTYTRSFGGDINMCNVLPECLAGEYLHVGTSLCMPPEQQCTEGQIKNASSGVCEDKCPAGMVQDASGLCKPSEDDCPVGQVRAPSGQCLPGDGQCAAGEARRKDGTCGRDADGDGVADIDDEDENNDDPKESFSGGDSCSSPPSCSGGPIDCGTARIQWRIDCNTRRTVNVTGGSCGAMPVCVGDNCKAMEYAQLLQQWKAACALEKLAGNEPGEGGDNQDLIDLLTDPGSIQPDLGGTGDMPGGGGYTWGEDGEDFDPDTSGMGWGSTCPSPPAISVFGQTVSFNLTPLCNWLALAGNLVLILASLASLRIVSGGTA